VWCYSVCHNEILSAGYVKMIYMDHHEILGKAKYWDMEQLTRWWWWCGSRSKNFSSTTDSTAAICRVLPSQRSGLKDCFVI